MFVPLGSDPIGTFFVILFVLFQPFGDVLRLTYETAQKSSGNVEQSKHKHYG